MKVWIVSLEWNHPPSEVTGDSGIVDVFHGPDAEQLARACQEQQQREFTAQGRKVYEFPTVDDNDDDWFIDVHCREYPVTVGEFRRQDTLALNNITAHLSGRSWSADDWDYIADQIAATGRVLEEPTE